jgi:hypothetical protein
LRSRAVGTFGAALRERAERSATASGLRSATIVF